MFQYTPLVFLFPIDFRELKRKVDDIFLLQCYNGLLPTWKISIITIYLSVGHFRSIYLQFLVRY